MAETTSLDGEYEPSPIPRIRDQVALYEQTDGVEGGTLEDRPVVILTSIGAQSGKVRKNPIMRMIDGDTYIAVASAAGAEKNPSWYANLQANPAVRVQDGSVVTTRIAREVSGDEKVKYWAIAETFWPHFPQYRERAKGRDIPIFVLEPLRIP
ncbi:nitroreductase family deazaflavin-dependent oxidoreductase [Herbiconiux sp. P16]|uniref:nitroreductase family deazaflavin-dependent oxidoreductase n=1 Tax=Herbiconiux wuyangfengii TaxID=3342794 RepID=UPI0035B83C69